MTQRWLIRAALAVALSVVLAPPGYAQPTWVSLGPHWNGNLGWLGLSRDWLRDGVMFSTMSGELVRTRDHGETWQRVATPTEGGSSDVRFWMLDGPSGRILFVGRAVALRGTEQGYRTTLYRSVDDGDQWERVWVGTPASLATMHWSPAFDRDQILFLGYGASIVRSTDAGASWEDVGQTFNSATPATRIEIGAVALSPSFATDRTIVLDLRRRAADPGTIPPELMRGLLISTDAGSTWQPLGVPAAHGATYASVEQVRFSPTYAEDGAMFAIASDGDSKGPGADATRHLFRSADRGQTWEVVQGPLPSDVYLALSPSFSRDRTILLGALLRADTTDSNGRCTIQRSTDAGATWSEPAVIASFSPRRYYNSTVGLCEPLQIEQAPDGVVALSGQRVSYDLGQTWQALAPPEQVTLARAMFSPGFAQDGTIFALTQGRGIWAYGSRTKGAAGSLGCTVPLADWIGDLFDRQPWAWPRLGCPSEPPTPARFTLGSPASGEDIWSSPTYGVRLTRAQSGPSTTPGVDDYWQSNAVNAALTFPEASDKVFDGFIQRFERGSAWGLFEQGGTLTRVVYLVGTDRGWYQVDNRR